MTKKALRQLEEIMQRPERTDISWSDAKRLLAAIGVRVRTGASSRLRFELNGVRAVIQRPADESEQYKFLAIALNHFFSKAGLRIDEV